MREQASQLVYERLEKISRDDVQGHSWLLMEHLMDMIQNNELDPIFFEDDIGEQLLIPVFSNITPNHPT